MRCEIKVVSASVAMPNPKMVTRTSRRYGIPAIRWPSSKNSGAMTRSGPSASRPTTKVRCALLGTIAERPTRIRLTVSSADSSGRSSGERSGMPSSIAARGAARRGRRPTATLPARGAATSPAWSQAAHPRTTTRRRRVSGSRSTTARAAVAEHQPRGDDHQVKERGDGEEHLQVEENSRLERRTAGGDVGRAGRRSKDLLVPRCLQAKLHPRARRGALGGRVTAPSEGRARGVLAIVNGSGEGAALSCALAQRLSCSSRRRGSR